jgi:hypothetical protein
MKLIKIISGAMIAPVFFMLTSCSNKEKTVWDQINFKPLNEIPVYIDGYYNTSLGEKAKPKSGNPTAYIDFSDGMVQAYKSNPQNVELIQAIAHKLVSTTVEWNALGDGKISSLPYTSTQLFNKVSDPKEYKTIMAPIQETLEKITAGKNDALLVTDFEEYTLDGKEQFSNYPKSSFIKWLKDGNSISFFYTDYTEVNVKSKITSAKHLYFAVFTYGRVNENSMVSMIRDAFKGRYTTKEFTLSNDPYTVSNDYGGKDKTGIQNKSISSLTHLIHNANLDKKLPYEVIGIQRPWDKDFDEKVQNYVVKQESGIFLSNLIMNASDQSSYKLNKVAVKVYDISDDYEHFSRSEEAKNNHQPKFVKDKGNNNVWSPESLKDPVITSCYEIDSDKLKSEWEYSKSPKSDKNLKIWDEIISCDEQVVTDNLKNSPDKVKLITKIHPNYKFKNIKNPTALLRVDYVIVDASFNDTNSQLQDFQWLSTTQANKTNTSLSEAIRNTLQDPDVKPKGKVIYSYFIKLANSTKK